MYIKNKSPNGQYIKNKFSQLFHSWYAVAIAELLILYLIIVIFSDNFISQENIYSILSSVALLGLLAMSESMVFMIGSIDLSTYAVYMLSGAAMTLFVSEYDIGFIPSALISILIGALIGIINGFFVTRIKLQPIIITIGTLLIAKGVSNILANSISNYTFPKLATVISEGKLYFIPISFLIVFMLMAICYFLLKHTIIGRQIFAVGGNEKAAQISGLNVDAIKILVYVSSSILASVAGVIFCTTPSASTKVLNGNNFEVILAVIIGGVSIYSRAGSMIRVLLGAAFVVIIKNLLSMSFVSDNYQIILIGCLFLIFSTIYHFKNKE